MIYIIYKKQTLQIEHKPNKTSRLKAKKKLSNTTIHPNASDYKNYAFSLYV